MIKLEHTILHKRGIIAFAAEASSEKDLQTLDILYQALSDKPNISAGYINSNRLVFHVSGMDKSLFELPLI